MMITRVFRVTIDPDLRSEFEAKFSMLSRQLLQGAAGCRSEDVLKPTRWSPDEYAMISTWEDEAALEAFAGERWCDAVIPTDMERYARTWSVSHYESWESAAT